MQTIQIDTRQQEGKHEAKHRHFADAGLNVIRTKLYVGDYMLVGGTVSCDTKASVSELAMNIDNQHERFREECVKARDAGITLVVLVENSDGIGCLDELPRWVNPRAAINRREGRRPPIDGVRLAKACRTMERRYGVLFRFCAPQEAGARVLEILEAEDG